MREIDDPRVVEHLADEQVFDAVPLDQFPIDAYLVGLNFDEGLSRDAVVVVGYAQHHVIGAVRRLDADRNAADRAPHRALMMSRACGEHDAGDRAPGVDKFALDLNALGRGLR